MDRRTAGAGRRRAAALAAGVALAGASVPATLADDLDDRQDRVERRIDRATEHLHDSTGRARSAARAVTAARAALSSARGHLAQTRGRLAVAEALDTRLQAELEAAEARLARARQRLADGRAEVRSQEAELRGLVAASYEQGDPDLLGLSMVLTSQDPSELAGTMSAGDDLLNLQAGVLDRLRATRVVLTVEKQEVAAARQEIAERREQAAENLDRMQGLTAQAQAQAQEVESLVGARTRAEARALDAKAADLQALRQLESERDRIAALIRQRATRTSYSGPVDGGGVLDMPVAGYVTSPFGWRTHPIWGYRSLHDGVDFGAGCGTPVHAAAAGTVLATYFSSSWGNRVILDHGVLEGVGVTTISNHLTSWTVSPGQRVARGQVVGYVGSTGWSTGCHLHFTVMQNGSPVDPMGWF